jgi:hypothetical protein
MKHQDNHPARFAKFWSERKKSFSILPIKDRRFLTRIGLAPDEAVSLAAYEALSMMPPSQMTFDFSNLASELAELRAYKDEIEFEAARAESAPVIFESD